MSERILFVNDTSLFTNWGCMATTTALQSLVRERFPAAALSYIYLERTQKPELITRSSYNKARQIVYSISPLNAGIRKVLIPVMKHPLNAWAYKYNKGDSIPSKAGDFDRMAKEWLKGKILQEELQLLTECDMVIVNGEGSIWDHIRDGRYLLFFLYFAKHYINKPCYMVNHTVQADDEQVAKMVRLVYPLLDYVCVREPRSLAELTRLGVDHGVVLAPDAVFSLEPSANWDFPQSLSQIVDIKHPFICVSGSSKFAGKTQEQRHEGINGFVTLVERLRKLVGQVILVADGFDTTRSLMFPEVQKMTGAPLVGMEYSYIDILNLLSRAQLYVSGRWHPSIFAAISGTPFIPLSANSHKMEGLTELLEYPIKPFEALELSNQIDEIIQKSEEMLENREVVGEKLKRRVETLKPLVRLNVAFPEVNRV